MRKMLKTALVFIAVLSMAGVGLVSFFPDLARQLSEKVTGHDTLVSELIAPTVMPWESIGGCGAGGSGGGGGGAKWVGKGISGGLLDLQLMYSRTVTRNFDSDQLGTRLSIKPAWNMGLGLSIPVAHKMGEVQPISNQNPRYYMSGGLGDLGLDYSLSLGAENDWSLGLATSLPTGQYDIKRGRDFGKEFLPSSLQMGSGMYNASATLSWTRDVAHGIWLFDLICAYPFNIKPFTGKNQFLDTYFPDYAGYKDSADSPDKRRFYYRFKWYGENDLGDYTPPSMTLSAYYGYRGMEGYVHSFGVTFGGQFGAAWIHGEPQNGLYNPRPDPDNKPWSATLNYGLEVSRMKYPIFFAVSLPFHSRSSVTNTWLDPDFSDFLNNWSFSVGVKSTMF